MQFETTNATIAYDQAGDGKMTLLFLHGWCINKEYWSNQVPFFAKNYNVYVMDLPGFGQSTSGRETWTIEEYANDVIGFMNKLDLNNVVLIGHSMSGSIMTELALTDHSRIIGLIGVDNFKDIDIQYSEEQLAQFDAALKAFKEDFQGMAPQYADMMLFHDSTPDDIRSRIKNDFANTDPKIGYESIVRYIQYNQQLADKLEQIPFKLYLLNSDAIPTNEEGLKKSV